MNQISSTQCSLCGSMGTNKSTCPMNPKASRPNAQVHQLVQQIRAQQPRAQQPIATNRYHIHWNAGTPFVVDDYKDQKKVIIYSYIDSGLMKKINEISYIKIFTKNPQFTYDGYDDVEGNTILLQTGKNTYILISNSVAEFNTIKNDQIITFVAPIGNNDVPYPYAIGKKYTYALDSANYANNKILPKKVFTLQQHPSDLVLNRSISWENFKFKLINYANHNHEEGPAGRYAIDPDLFL